MVRKLQWLLNGVPYALYNDERPTRMGNLACGPRVQSRLTPEYAQDLLARAGHPKNGAVEQVLNMSVRQRGFIHSSPECEYRRSVVRDHRIRFVDRSA